MMGWGAKKEGGRTGHRFRRSLVRLALAFVLLGFFLGGYTYVSKEPVVQQCAAASNDPLLPAWPYPESIFTTFNDVSKEPFIVQTYCPPCTIATWPSTCNPPLTTRGLALWLRGELLNKLATTAIAIERFIGNWLIDGMMAVMIEVLNQAELNLIDWWDTFWFYNLNPAMQDMTKQFSVSLTDQVRSMQATVDMRIATEVQKARREADNEARKQLAPSENAAVLGTLVGGQVRAQAISGLMQVALQEENGTVALNKQTMPDGSLNVKAAGRAGALAAKRAQYEALFCDPAGNAGGNRCNGAPPEFYNIDTQVTKQIYSRLTIDLIGSSGAPPQTASVDEPGFASPMFTKAAKAAATPNQGTTLQTAQAPAPLDPANPGTKEIPEETLNAILENMVGDTMMDPIPRPALLTWSGQERYLKRRDYLARYAAIRSLPQFLIGRRMPGSQLGTYVEQVRTAAGVQPEEISPNPSQREVMHAMVVDRFNSGQFAVGMITDQAVIEREKLLENTLYLMQLRDYYELLERQSLVLAVQISIMADEKSLPDATLQPNLQ